MHSKKIRIREAKLTDFDTVMEIETLAFGSAEEAKLVEKLVADKSARPVISLLAFYNNEAVGHILFTRVYFEDYPEILAHILAPLAVIPTFQKQGIGGLLIKKGLNFLKEKNSQIVFVLGHTAYYPKFGFVPDAGSLGFAAPYPIPEEHADAWMVQEFKEGTLGKWKGKIRCANSLMKPEYWVE